MAFGGAGPIHAAGVARELGIRRVLVPPGYSASLDAHGSILVEVGNA